MLNDTVQPVAATSKMKEVYVKFHVSNEDAFIMGAPYNKFAEIKNIIINQFKEGGEFIKVTNENNKDVLNLTYMQNSGVHNVK